MATSTQPFREHPVEGEERTRPERILGERWGTGLVDPGGPMRPGDHLARLAGPVRGSDDEGTGDRGLLVVTGRGLQDAPGDRAVRDAAFEGLDTEQLTWAVRRLLGCGVEVVDEGFALRGVRPDAAAHSPGRGRAPRRGRHR